MKRRPTLDEYKRLLTEISIPADIVSLNTAQALGMRLARPVVLRSVFPDRPFSLADGLALAGADVVVRGDRQTSAPRSSSASLAGTDLTCHVNLDGKVSSAITDTASEPESFGSVSLQLRPPPATNRREDAIQPGEAVALGIGEEIPRGADLIYPLELLSAEPISPTVDSDPEPQSAEPSEAEAEQANGDGIDGQPLVEPKRDWDLPARFAEGWVEVDKIPRAFKAHIPIGAWARRRDSLIQEKTVLRPADIALLDAAQVTEVEVFRRPTVGVADFSPPFPRANPVEGSSEAVGPGPIGSLAFQLVRAAQVSALSLKNAPCDFHALVRRVKHWLGQVDVLLLVGGSHYGSGCIGRDVITAIGELVVDGVDLEIGGGLSVGMIEGKPVCSIPGSLPDVLIPTVLCVRPLLHRQLEPRNWHAEIELELEYGSQLSAPVNRAVPVRFGFDRGRGVYTSRYNGRSQDPWLDYIQGQALVVLEAGREYQDGELVPATLY